MSDNLSYFQVFEWFWTRYRNSQEGLNDGERVQAEQDRPYSRNNRKNATDTNVSVLTAVTRQA